MGALSRVLGPLGYRVLEVQSDGHCLYRAVAHQVGTGVCVGVCGGWLVASISLPSVPGTLYLTCLPLHATKKTQLGRHKKRGERPPTFGEMRALAASYLRSHPDDFLPFMDLPKGEEGQDAGGARVWFVGLPPL